MGQFRNRTKPSVFGVLIVLAVALAVYADDSKPTRRPVPSAAAQAEAEKLIRDLFKTDYARRRPADQLALATRLLAEGRNTSDNATGRFVLFREARDLAIAAGDAVVACEAVDALAGDFTLEPLPGKADVIQRLSKSATTPGVHRELADLSVGLMAQALQNDEYDSAVRLGDIAATCAARCGNPAYRKQVDAKVEACRLAEKEFAQVRPAIDLLRSRPDDQAANGAVGRFRCLVKGDWEAGVLLLARGPDDRLRQVARLDLRRPVNPPDQVEVGDGWWDLAEAERGLIRTNLQRRAGHWYKLAAPKLTGLTQAKVDRRLQQVGALVADEPEESSGPVGMFQVLSGHGNAVMGVAITPDGRRIVSCSQDKTARVWDAATGQEVTRFGGHTQAVWSVAVSPDGRSAATAGADKSIWVWDISTGRESFRLDGHADQVIGVAYFPDGKRLLSGGVDLTVRVWNLDTHKELRRFVGHTGNIHHLAISPDKRLIASSSNDRTIRLWNLQTGKPAGVLVGHTGMVFDLAFSPDGRRLYSGGQDDTWRTWDLDTGKEIRRGAGGEALALSPDGKRILTGAKNGILYLYEASTGREIGHWPGTAGSINAVAFFPDGRRAATGGGDRMVRLWRLP